MCVCVCVCVWVGVCGCVCVGVIYIVSKYVFQPNKSIQTISK